MKMSVKAKNLLTYIGGREGAYFLPVNKKNARAAQELKDLGLALYIPKADGGADICLNREGIIEYEELVK